MMFLTEKWRRGEFQVVLLGGLAALALTLACVGIYGVMSYLVMQQTHEIGVRMGAWRTFPEHLGLVLGRGAKLTATGVSIGIAAALLVTRLMRSLLFAVSPFDLQRLRASPFCSYLSRSRRATSPRGARCGLIRSWPCGTNDSRNDVGLRCHIVGSTIVGSDCKLYSVANESVSDWTMRFSFISNSK